MQFTYCFFCKKYTYEVNGTTTNCLDEDDVEDFKKAFLELGHEVIYFESIIYNGIRSDVVFYTIFGKHHWIVQDLGSKVTGPFKVIKRLSY